MKRHPTLFTGLLILVALGTASCGGPSPATAAPAPTATSAPTVPSEPQGWISYDSRAAGYWGIYLVRADGSGEAAPLTAHPNGEYWSAWSPDGTTIAFTSYRDSAGPGGNPSLYTIRLDGTGLTRLTDGAGMVGMPAWSPSGEEIAFSSDQDAGNPDIYVIDAAGGGLRRLTDDPGTDEWPSWSPDGEHIVFHSDRGGAVQIHVMNADGTQVTQLTFDTGTGALAYLGIVPEPSADGLAVVDVVEGGPAERAGLRQGDRIQAIDNVTLTQGEELTALLRTHQPGDEVSLSLVRNGSPLTIVVTLGTAPQRSGFPDWSPDGSRIAFASTRDGDWDIYVMEADGGNVQPVTRNDDADLYPSWSPDGQHLAFASDSAGNVDVYVIRADGANLRQLTSDPTDEYPPRWGPTQASVSDEPRFGPLLCGRDTNADGLMDAATSSFTQGDESFFVSFSYANVSPDLPWSLDLVMENAETQSYTEPWGGSAAGILTVRFPNWIGSSFELPGGIHGTEINIYPAGTLRVQLTLGDDLVQEIECQVEAP